MSLDDLKAMIEKWAGAANAALEAGRDVAPFVKIAFLTFATGGVTDEKLKTLQAFNDAMAAELDAPLEDDPAK